jgi:hypothetical protein
MYVPPYLLVQTILDAPLVCCSSILQPEQHGDVAKGSKGRDERSLVLIIDFHPDLVIT